MSEPSDFSGWCLVLRLAGPLQSWGGHSQFNRRDTRPEPTKSGIIGLIAAAQGRRRQDPIEDLLRLSFGIRVDQPGSTLRDYHTVSDLRGRPLPSAAVNAKGVQKTTSPQKWTHVTHRYYLQDAVFVAAVSGPRDVLENLRDALRSPEFPLCLGRRACPPTQPLILRPSPDDPYALWPGTSLLDVLTRVPWAAGDAWKVRLRHRASRTILPVTLDDPHGDDVRDDVPTSFDPHHRAFTSRRVRQDWVDLTPDDHTPPPADTDNNHDHDPFALLGGDL
ncbi:type I-E CRISPR-associated protein Cas5/CasD [Solwaraspora sp. WMMD406]|uniref:type I-E CRISPR-associated protein Cas5/CasD n=1 Tax=Solwaraspora sp. WMMD406 TaxID=3016095 RepID=UPI00241645DF|nr:type I-E CRISPR-associated protein Cas5/CasD [Solwaraspora sp. WMMD406]MDG4768643.1 type I-E CRISPR-associated protein Cas5/CasD [Solwaraspora sp. WMMD406]